MNSDRAVQNGLKAAATVKVFLEEMELSPTEQKLSNGVAFHVALDGPADQGIAQIQTPAERFVFHFIFPGYVPADKRMRLAEFITRANWGLIEGNFELNFETGVLRYKVGLDFTFAELAEPFVRNAILSGMNAIEMFTEALQAVLETDMEPEEAYRTLARPANQDMDSDL